MEESQLSGERPDHVQRTEHQKGGQESFNHQALTLVDAWCQCSGDLGDSAKRTEKSQKTSTSDTSSNLSDEEDDSSERTDGADKVETESYGGIEETSGNTVEHPSSHQERQAHRDRDVHDGLAVETSLGTLETIRDTGQSSFGSTKTEEQA